MNFLRSLKRWVRYAYFLRFSLALWLFAPILCLLDAFYTKSLTSGILTPETLEQYVCVGFFLASAGFVAMVSARVVLINGPERWDRYYDETSAAPERDDGRPSLLTALLVNPNGHLEWLALILSQLPSAAAGLYMIFNAEKAGVPFHTVFWGIQFGALLAWILWGIANAWYYLTYIAVAATAAKDPVQFGSNAARTLLFPRSLFALTRVGRDYSDDTLEGASTGFENGKIVGALRAFANVFHRSKTPGYVYSVDGKARFFEGHAFSILAVTVFLGLYLIIWPLTAPVPALWTSVAMLVVLYLSAIVIIALFWKAPQSSRPGIKLPWRWGLTAATLFFCFSVTGLYLLSSAERFPIFATILIMVTALFWLLGGLAFFLDRYRVPVFTVFLLLLLVPRLLHLDRTIYMHAAQGEHWPLHWGNSQEEHYLSVNALNSQDALAQVKVPTPAEILDQALAADRDGRPLIIVTATGGGLHASAWTAAVLAQLEDQFDRDNPQLPKGSLHNHLLLASTVSGGSVGLLSYLRELNSATPDFTRMQVTAQCSSLEAVGWGLVYYDLQKALIPFFPYIFPPSSGVDNLDFTPLGKDRTWALRKAFSRNLQNDYCQATWNRDHNQPQPTSLQLLLRTNVNAENDSAEELEKHLTLRNLIPGYSGLPGAKVPFPAFAMNTTASETGERFLSANYQVPYKELDTCPNYKARTFLKTFERTESSAQPLWVSDLPLATAAQMSATFPYVSSAARAPMIFDNNVGSVHFVDGGYYDNDGTASAAEFLRYALVRPDASAAPSCNPTAQVNKEEAAPPATHAADTKPPLRVLLIEIRNSGDIGGASESEAGGDHSCNGCNPAPANLLGQLGSPLTAFWQAGHESVTARNRVLLSQLEHALSGKLLVHRVVLADLRSQVVVATDPLSWSLTPAQRKEVQETASGDGIKGYYNEASQWFSKDLDYWKYHADSDWPE